jgi:hypothetical protein
MSNSRSVSFGWKKCPFWVMWSTIMELPIDPNKIEAIVDWERPTNVQDIWSFAGLAGYYRRFIEGFSALSGPLTSLTRKNAPYVWSKACEASFQEPKRRPVTGPTLSLPTESVGYMVYKMHHGWGWDACLCKKARHSLCLKAIERS